MAENQEVNERRLVKQSLAPPLVEIVGGDAFFLPQANEEAIRGPVFPRGRGAGPGFRIQAGCDSEVQVWISGAGGERVADLAANQLSPGNYEASWNWASLSGWSVPDEIPVGQYRVHVASSCLDDVAVLPFYVVFDPAAVGGPPRFSFDGVTVWFGAGVNAVFGLHYYLRCSDWRVFRIALGAAAGHTDPYAAAIAVARAEERQFGYSLDYQTNDVVDLLVNYSEAQCADDAACLTSFLRTIGIPARPVSADAALETGAANWTFDTWVEFLAEHEGALAWRILHPHEYPGMQPEPRHVFGRRGVANKGFNDLIITASEAWAESELDDGAVSVVYARNACGEPHEMVAKAPWVEELCESGYWPQAHWECPETDMRRPFASKGLRLSGEPLVFGGRLAGSIHLHNATPNRQFGRLVLELVACRTESMAFVEKVLYVIAFPVALDPNESVTLAFDCGLPATLAPGRVLCLRALFNERIVLIKELHMRLSLEARFDMPAVWQEGGEQSICVRIQNTGTFALQAVELRLAAPYALLIDRLGPEHFDVLAPGEERSTTVVIRALARLSSGSLHVTVASANGGGLMLRKPFRVEAPT